MDEIAKGSTLFQEKKIISALMVVLMSFFKQFEGTLHEICI